MNRQAHQDKEVGKTRDTGYQVGTRRTYPIGLKQAWRLIISPEAVRIWQGDSPNPSFVKGAVYFLPDGTAGQVRVFKPGSYLRITWQPRHWDKPSTLQIRIFPNGYKTVFAFHQENLPGPEARQQRLIFF